MVLESIFKEFIQVVRQNPKYIIGLLNHDGKVIACSREDYVGKRLDLNNHTDYDMFYELKIKHHDYGYFWVNSEDDSRRMIGTLLIDTLTTRIVYEINEKKLKKKLTIDDKLIKCLLDRDKFDMHRIIALIKELDIDENKARIAIYITHHGGFQVEEIMRLKLKTDSKELIYSLLDKNTLLLFKDVPPLLNDEELKKYIQKYVKSLNAWGLYDCCYYVGTIQNRLKQYSVSYNNCLWLKQNIPNTKNKPLFFVDYRFDYLISQISLDEVLNMFQYDKERSKDINMDEFINISNQMIINDYNITKTAEELFLHKNTLLYKLKKYEEIFNIDIRGSFQGKLLMLLISSSFKEYLKRKQVGETI